MIPNGKLTIIFALLFLTSLLCHTKAAYAAGSYYRSECNYFFDRLAENLIKRELCKNRQSCFSNFEINASCHTGIEIIIFSKKNMKKKSFLIINEEIDALVSSGANHGACVKVITYEKPREYYINNITSRIFESQERHVK